MKEKIKISSNRSFGIVFFVVFLLIGIYPLANHGNIYIWAIITSLIFFLLGIFNSRILTSLNILWFRFGLFLGKIFAPLIMGIIFFLIVTPTGLIMRLIKKDFLNLKFNKDRSYWITKNDSKSKMKNQY